jgi:hypothetical protein
VTKPGDRRARYRCDPAPAERPGAPGSVLTDAVAAIEQAQKSEGNLGADALADANNAWWSVSSWQARGPMRAFVGSEPRRSITTRLDHYCDEGALPVNSTLLREFPHSGPGGQNALAHRWGRCAHQWAAGFRAAEHRGLAVRLPLDPATAVIESVSAQGELVSIQLYGHPWVMGEYWPMITLCFQVRATDDAGDEHEGMPGSIWVTLSTLWEAAWAEIELPR